MEPANTFVAPLSDRELLNPLGSTIDDEILFTNLQDDEEWQPYENCHALPLPFIQMSPRLSNQLRRWYFYRWKVLGCLLRPCPYIGLHCDCMVGDVVALLVSSIGFLLWMIYTYMNTIRNKECVADAGEIPCVSLAITFILVMHNSLLTLVFGVSFERLLRYHKYFGTLTFVGGFIHGFLYITDELDGVVVTDHRRLMAMHNGAHGGVNGEHGVGNLSTAMTQSQTLTGVIMLGSIFLMIIFALPPIRHLFFRYFITLHRLLALVVIVTFAIHVHIERTRWSILACIGIWFLDVVYRYCWQGLRHNTRKAYTQRISCNITKITLSKGKIQYKAGQYMFLCIPQLGIFEWHPFSIASSPHEKDITFYIRCRSRWTKDLLEMATETSQSIDILMEGPYGETTLNLDDESYHYFLFISGGIGGTPLRSIANCLMHQKKRGRDVNSIWWIRCDRGISDEDPYAAQFLDNLSLSPDEIVHSEIYLTRIIDEDTPSIQTNRNLEVQKSDIHFGKPSVEDIIARMRQSFPTQNSACRVAVIGCGPESMMNAIRYSCAKESKSGVCFDVCTMSFQF